MFLPSLLVLYIFVFVIPLVDVHLLICIMNWTVYKWFPTDPNSGSLTVFLISGAFDACEMVLLKGVGTNRRRVLLSRAHFNWNWLHTVIFTPKSQKEPATQGLGRLAFLR